MLSVSLYADDTDVFLFYFQLHMPKGRKWSHSRNIGHKTKCTGTRQTGKEYDPVNTLVYQMCSQHLVNKQTRDISDQIFSNQDNTEWDLTTPRQIICWKLVNNHKAGKVEEEKILPFLTKRSFHFSKWTQTKTYLKKELGWKHKRG